MPDAGDLLELARQALAYDDHAKALPLLQEALRRAPDSSEGYMLLGVCLWASGSRAEGIRAAERATELDPNSARSHYNLAVMLRETGRTLEAATHFQAALRLDPGHQGAAAALHALQIPVAAEQRGDATSQCATRVGASTGNGTAGSTSRPEDEAAAAPPQHEPQVNPVAADPGEAASAPGPHSRSPEEPTVGTDGRSTTEEVGPPDAAPSESVDRLWEEEQSFMRWWGQIVDRCAGLGGPDHQGDAGRRGIVAVLTRWCRLAARRIRSRRQGD